MVVREIIPHEDVVEENNSRFKRRVFNRCCNDLHKILELRTSQSNSLCFAKLLVLEHAILWRLLQDLNIEMAMIVSYEAEKILVSEKGTFFSFVQ